MLRYSCDICTCHIPDGELYYYVQEEKLAGEGPVKSPARHVCTDCRDRIGLPSVLGLSIVIRVSRVGVTW